AKTRRWQSRSNRSRRRQHNDTRSRTGTPAAAWRMAHGAVAERAMGGRHRVAQQQLRRVRERARYRGCARQGTQGLRRRAREEDGGEGGGPVSRRLVYTLANGEILVQPVGEAEEMPAVRYEIQKWKGADAKVVAQALRSVAEAIEAFDRKFEVPT